MKKLISCDSVAVVVRINASTGLVELRVC